jgi:hypothetical protein
MNIPPLAVSLVLAAAAVAAIEWSGRSYEGAEVVEGLEPASDRLSPDTQRGQVSVEGTSREYRPTAEVENPPVSPTPGTEAAEESPAEAETRLAELRAQNLVQRRKRLERDIHQRSVRIADELGLGTGAELKIARVLLDEFDEVTAIQAELRTGDRSPEAVARNRARVDEIPRKREERFARLLGPEAARKIVEYQDRLVDGLSESVKKPLDDN